MFNFNNSFSNKKNYLVHLLSQFFVVSVSVLFVTLILPKEQVYNNYK